MQELLASGTIYEIKYLEKNRSVLFPQTPDYPGASQTAADADLRELWHGVVMPKSQVELEERLHAAGHLSDAQYRAGHLEKSRAMQAAIKLAAGQKLISDAERRAKRRKYPQKLTNTHLLGQFEWFQAPAPKGGAAAGSTGASGGAAPR